MNRFSAAFLFAFTFTAFSAHSALALEIEFSAGGPSIVVVDDGAGDLNTDAGTIDFDLSGNGTIPDLTGGGRVIQTFGVVGGGLQVTATPPNAFGTLQNTGGSAMSLVVTVRSDDPYAEIGDPLGWRLGYIGEIADVNLGNADVTGHTVNLFVNGEGTPLASTGVADVNAPGDPPIPFDVGAVPSADPDKVATSTQLVLAATLGTDDELRLTGDELGEGFGLYAAVFNNDAKCIHQLNTRASKVLQAEHKGDTLCIKLAYGAGGGDAAACVDAPSTIGENAENQLLAAMTINNCNPPPAWGVNGATCCDGGSNDADTCNDGSDCPGGGCVTGACISGAAQLAANDLAHDVFGANISIGTTYTGKCQLSLFSQIYKGTVGAWKQVAKCKKVNFNLISDDADFETACLNPLFEKAELMFARAALKIERLALKCELYGISPVGSAFPGECETAATPADLKDCVIARMRCRLCQALNFADDIDAGVFDCDDFDDANANGSCADLSGATTTTTTPSTTSTTL